MLYSSDLRPVALPLGTLTSRVIRAIEYRNETVVSVRTQSRTPRYNLATLSFNWEVVVSIMLAPERLVVAVAAHPVIYTSWVTSLMGSCGLIRHLTGTKPPLVKRSGGGAGNYVSRVVMQSVCLGRERVELQMERPMRIMVCPRIWSCPSI